MELIADDSDHWLEGIPAECGADEPVVWLELGVDDPPDLGSRIAWNNLRSRIPDHVAVG